MQIFSLFYSHTLYQSGPIMCKFMLIQPSKIYVYRTLFPLELQGGYNVLVVCVWGSLAGFIPFFEPFLFWHHIQHNFFFSLENWLPAQENWLFLFCYFTSNSEQQTRKRWAEGQTVSQEKYVPKKTKQTNTKTFSCPTKREKTIFLYKKPYISNNIKLFTKQKHFKMLKKKKRSTYNKTQQIKKTCDIT